MKTRRHFILLVLSMKFNEVQQYEEKCTYIPWYTYEKFISRHLEMHLFKLIKFEPLSLTKYACTKVISIYSTSFPWWHRMLGWHFKISCYSAAWANLFIFFFFKYIDGTSSWIVPRYLKMKINITNSSNKLAFAYGAPRLLKAPIIMNSH